MSRRVYCPSGHSWEPSPPPWPQATDFPVGCPVCGRVVARTAEELEDVQAEYEKTLTELQLPPEDRPVRE